MDRKVAFVIGDFLETGRGLSLGSLNAPSVPSVRYGALGAFREQVARPGTIIAATSCVIANGSHRSELPRFIAAEKRET